MGKSSRKILAIILSIGILATLVAVPVTVSAVPADETYEAYDVVTYRDLLSGGNPLTAAKTSISGNPKFAYNCTSPTYSVIFKYRWTAGTCAEGKPHYVFYFDKWGGSAYPFCLAVKSPGYSGLGAAAGANGAWHLDPSKNDHIVQMDAPIVIGQNYDIEHARLKVATGANAGKYYVYVKVNGELIYDYYYDGDNGNGTYGNDNQAFDPTYLRFTDGTSDNYISAIPEPDVYDDYDEVTYYDFVKDDALLYDTYPNEYSINDNKFTYNKTSEYGSAVIKYRWKGANTGSSFYISFDPPPKTSDPSQPATEYTFGILYSGSAGTIWLRIGNGSAKALSEPLTMGNDYDIEYGRLKVIGGDNAGKYKLYIRITDVETGDEMYYEEKYIEASVVDANGQYTSNTDGAGSGVTCTISNSFRINFWGNGGNKIAPIPVPETYEDYDEVYYSNLYKGGNPVSSEGSGNGSVYTYNRTSDSYSAILKLRWKNANPATQFQISFDRKGSENAINYMFGVQLYSAGGEYPNGRVWLRPGYGPSVAFTEPIQSGQNYDIEFARLKVATGPNAGKYYMYFKMNDVLLAEDYVAADAVDSEGNYTSNPGPTACQLSNEIYITFWGGGGATITNPAFTETYCDYDDVGYSDLSVGGNPVSANKRNMSGGTVLTYNRTSETGSVIFKYRWKVGDVAKFQMSFDEKASTDRSNMEYMFGAWLSNPGDTYANGDMYLRPSYGSHVGLAAALTPGGTYDIEYGRLKVATGPNKDKYYVYIKIDDVLIDESYVAADVVDADGNYTTKPGDVQCNVKAGEIFIAYWGSNGNMIGTYGGIKGDLDNNFVVDGFDMAILRKVILQYEEASGISADIADFNSDSIVDVKDYKALKSAIVS